MSGLPDVFEPTMVAPIVERFSAWSPNFIAVETMSGLTCEMMRQMPSRYASSLSRFCYDTSSATTAAGLNVFEATALIEERLADGQTENASDRRRNALLFLAAGEPGSALVQWLYLPQSERSAQDGLTEALVGELEGRREQQSEISLIAAPIAVRSGLQRLWSVDAQDFYAGATDWEAYGAALNAAWDNPASQQRAEDREALYSLLAEPGAFLQMYQASNSPEFAALAYESDWGAALAEQSQGQYGRRYVAYWETRNLRMVANMREVLGRSPGSRMLAIVGESHKAYYEAYLAQMRDVELIDVLPILEE
ncbi:DUF5694 domain-containing protein [Aurantiacibacter sediminis]|uniref:DUF5694 domain-containing protein n=1 Tax=Aurantiacibacter sediminis TaxID=2793064 RepID=UPI0030DBA6C7